MALSPSQKKEYKHIASLLGVYGLYGTVHRVVPKDKKLLETFRLVKLFHQKGKEELESYLHKKIGKTKSCGCNICHLK